MKKLLLFALFALSNACLAIPLAGNYTIGATGSDYATITAAVQALAAEGISAPVVFDIRPGTYTGSYSFPLITGSTPFNTITFRSLTGNAADVILKKQSGTIVAVGGKNYRFSKLTFYVYTSSSSNNNAVSMGSTCENIHVSNCIFDGASSYTTSSYNSSESTKQASAFIVLGGNTIYVELNLFKGSGTAVYRAYNSSVPESTFVFIISNTFTGSFVTLTEVNKIRSLSFSANENTGSVQYITLKALNLAGPNTVSGNNLQSTNVDVNSLYSVYLSGVSTEASQIDIRNNFFVTGTNLSAGGFADATICNNSFKTAKSHCLLLEDNPLLQQYRVYNNIFATDAAYGNVRYTASLPLAKVSMDNNAYSKEIHAIQYFTAFTGENNFYNLSGWKTFASRDQNSLVVDEVYASATDLHTPNAFMLNGAGSSIPLTLEDIDGDSRSMVPDIGADEFNMNLATYRDLEMVAVVSPTGSGCAPMPFVVSVKNNSVAAVNSFSIECSLNGFRGNVNRYVQTINPGQTVPVPVNGCEIVPNTVYDTFDFYVSQPNDLLDNNYANNKVSVADIFQLGSFNILDQTNQCNSEHQLTVPKVGQTTVLWSTGAATNNITVTQPGTYSATLTASNGCSVTQSITIN